MGKRSLKSSANARKYWWRFLVLLFLGITAVSCEEEGTVIQPSELTRNGNVLFYQGKPYTGRIREMEPRTGTTIESEYEEGLLHGEQKETYPNGQVASIRKFENGKQVGIHKGWFPDGKRRFVYQYSSDGFLEGEVWDWHPNGKLARFGKYKRGHLIGLKIWRNTGKIYANYVRSKERIIGLAGGKLCRQVKNDEKGEVVEF